MPSCPAGSACCTMSAPWKCCHLSCWCSPARAPCCCTVRRPSVSDSRTEKRGCPCGHPQPMEQDRKSTRLNSSHVKISYAVFCLKKKKKNEGRPRRKRPGER